MTSDSLVSRVGSPGMGEYDDDSVEGSRYDVSPVCPHLGGIVNWNEAGKSWECPLHGSRFAPDGAVLEGPATRCLTASS